jgi:hypothetical protein
MPIASCSGHRGVAKPSSQQLTFEELIKPVTLDERNLTLNSVRKAIKPVSRGLNDRHCSATVKAR